MSAGVAVRPYRPGDEHAILRTFNLVFREVCGPTFVDRTLEQWRWAYRDNPAGHRILLAVADDGTVASHYAGMPMLCDTPWGEHRFVHCVDSMTHPAYRQGLRAKTLFVETCLLFREHSRVTGDALYYGFPVDAAFRIGQRYLHYDMLLAIDFLIRELQAEPLQAPDGVAVARGERVPPDANALYDRVRADKETLVRRDHRYLQWRYADNPAHADYELWTARRGEQLAGLLVLKPGSGLAPDSATIVDWLVPEHDAAAAAALLATAARRQREAGRQRLLAVFPPWSHEWRTLLAHGFQPVPSSTWLQRRLVQHANDPRFTAEHLERSWWYTLGDSDLA
jgi:hypothetical protein